tara:strand:- start:281 stop:541 length:261 start_codon:yes stop_codon:yes gene_type:complete
MTFEEAFKTFILDKKIISWGFQQPVKTLLPNGYYAYPAGYFTVYENNYRLIFNGASLEKADIQEAIILDPAGMPIARDTETIYYFD